MSRKQKLHLQEEVSPNLIPMIDIMFLLLLFFMLGADMGHRDIEEVSLPKATSIKEDKDAKGKQHDRLTINVFHRYLSEIACAAHEAGHSCRNEKHWKVGIHGNDYTEPAKLAVFLKSEAEEFKGDDPKSRTSERRVMIRADGAAPYGFIQDVMGACARVGIYQIECGAARPVDAREKVVNL